MITVFGSLNADYVFRVQALPQPGETVLCPSYQILPGGKGANQACAAARRGAPVRMVGAVGKDTAADIVRRGLTQAGVDAELLRLSEEPTGIAVIGVDRAGENQIIVASGANHDIDADALLRLDPALGEDDVLLCQNEILPEATHAALIAAKALGARTILNLAPAGPLPPEVLAAIDVLIVNLGEARATARRLSGDAVELAGLLAQRHQLACIVTEGGDGAVLAHRGRVVRARPPAVTVVDTTGAGDTFCGVFAAASGLGVSLEEALRQACCAGALACTRLGAQASQPSGDEIAGKLAAAPPLEHLR